MTASSLRCGSVSLKHDSRRTSKTKLALTNYILCIICQANDKKNMLHDAMEGICDEPAERLKTIATQKN